MLLNCVLYKVVFDRHIFPDYKIDENYDSFFKQESTPFDNYAMAKEKFDEHVKYVNQIITFKEHEVLLKKPLVLEMHGYDHGQWVCLHAYNVNATSWYT